MELKITNLFGTLLFEDDKITTHSNYQDIVYNILHEVNAFKQYKDCFDFQNNKLKQDKLKILFDKMFKNNETFFYHFNGYSESEINILKSYDTNKLASDVAIIYNQEGTGLKLFDFIDGICCFYNDDIIVKIITENDSIIYFNFFFGIHNETILLIYENGLVVDSNFKHLLKSNDIYNSIINLILNWDDNVKSFKPEEENTEEKLNKIKSGVENAFGYTVAINPDIEGSLIILIEETNVNYDILFNNISILSDLYITNVKKFISKHNTQILIIFEDEDENYDISEEIEIEYDKSYITEIIESIISNSVNLIENKLNISINDESEIVNIENSLLKLINNNK